MRRLMEQFIRITVDITVCIVLYALNMCVVSVSLACLRAMIYRCDTYLLIYNEIFVPRGGCVR